jgi:hypothetical protein
MLWQPFDRLGRSGSIISQISLDTVIALPLRSIENGRQDHRLGCRSDGSPHNYELRYWLAAGAPSRLLRAETLRPDGAEALLSVTPATA